MALASGLGFAAVALGAFGAHALKGWLATLEDGAQRLAWWETATTYHLTHALALGLAAMVLARVEHVAARIACWAFVVGVALFSGSLYTMTLTGVRWLGAITPLGGLALLLGWAALGWAALQSPG